MACPHKEQNNGPQATLETSYHIVNWGSGPYFSAETSTSHSGLQGCISKKLGVKSQGDIESESQSRLQLGTGPEKKSQVRPPGLLQQDKSHTLT